MKNLVIVLWLILGASGEAMPSPEKDDFLTSEEITSIRDAEDGGKRVLLYLEFAGRRIGAAQEKMASKEAGAGREIQKNLAEYNSILEALDDALAMARHDRVPLSKLLKELQAQGDHYLKVLQQLAQAPSRSDFQFTVEEAVDMTNEELAQAKKGAYPEVQERKPPSDLPSKPPPPAKSGNTEEGPPRKKGRSSPGGP